MVSEKVEDAKSITVARVNLASDSMPAIDLVQGSGLKVVLVVYTVLEVTG